MRNYSTFNHSTLNYGALNYGVLKNAVLLVLLINIAACSSRQRAEDESGFYTYVDPQGNVITIDNSKQSELQTKLQENEQHSTLTDDALREAAPLAAVEPVNSASAMDSLWSAREDEYITSQELEATLLEKERQRFVSYPDETGRMQTHALDLAAEREARATARKNEQQARQGQLLSEGVIRVEEGWRSISADCCRDILNSAIELDDGDDKRLIFSASQSIDLDKKRPALAYRLSSTVSAISLQSWNKSGYLYPELMFLDQNGFPMLEVNNVLIRYKPENWASKASLSGRVPVEPGAAWVVVWLGYASILDEGSDEKALVLESNAIRLGDISFPLTLKGEAVIYAGKDER